MSGVPYRSATQIGRDSLLDVMHAEWTKFRTVRGLMLGAAAAAMLMVLTAVFTGLGSRTTSCNSIGSGPLTCRTGSTDVVRGPDGKPVIDTFYFVHRTLNGDGSVTVHINRFSAVVPSVSHAHSAPLLGQEPSLRNGLVPWAKAGLIVKQSDRPGTAYAAIMLTGAHGVHLQYDFRNDISVPSSSRSAVPEWLRLVKSGDRLTGFRSADGVHWNKVGAITLRALSRSVQVGLFVTSPDYMRIDRHLFSTNTNGGPSVATAGFDHLSVHGSLYEPWRGQTVGLSATGEGRAGRFKQQGGSFTVYGSGDIAPAVGDRSGRGTERTLAGTFAALIALTVIAALFVTAEYRRGLIRVTFAASPRRGRVLAAKSLVAGAVAFGAGLLGAGIAIPVGDGMLRSNGNYVYPIGTLTELRVIIGTAAFLAGASVLAVAIGVIARRSAAAVTAVILLIVFPYILAVASALPSGASDWLLRTTPAAAFAVQQTLPHYAQVNWAYAVSNGYYPMGAWPGMAVLFGYAGVAFAIAAYLVRRRDV